MRHAFITILGLVACAWLAGCARENKSVDFDPHFSINVTHTPKWYSHEAMALSPVQRSVLYKKGRPDFIRIWWMADGSLITTSDLTAKYEQLPEILAERPKSWIYLMDEEELIFNAETTDYRVEPLSDPLELVCTYGDPNDRVPPAYIDGREHETWIWYEYGLKVTLVDGKVYKKERMFRPTGRGTYLGK